MLVQIETKAVWNECFHSFKAALVEYLKQRPTLPATSLSLPVSQAITLVAGNMHRAADASTSPIGAADRSRIQSPSCHVGELRLFAVFPDYESPSFQVNCGTAPCQPGP